MKKKNVKRFFTIVFSLLLAVAFLSPVLFTPVAAVSATIKSTKDDKEWAKPGKRPSYTDTLIKNNELLEKLSASSNKKNKVLSKMKSDGVEWMKFANQLVNVLDEDATGTETVDFLLDTMVAVSGIWGLSGISGAVLDGLRSSLVSGKPSLTEIQELTNDMKQSFDGMEDHLYEIEEEIAALSNQMTQSVYELAAITQSQINNLESKELLREFMMSGNGGFSYLDFSNYIYGTENLYTKSTEAYATRLLEAIVERRSDETLQSYYNNLFNALYDDTSNVWMFSQYYFGEVIGMEDKSIAMHYYDYLSYNPSLVPEGSTAEYEALMFALDLYTSYKYSYELLEMCFAYQLTDMAINETDEYEYKAGKTIDAATIEKDYNKKIIADVKADTQAAKDITYILGMKNSYIVEDDRGDLHDIVNSGDSFGNLADGQTLYLNVFSDHACELFMLDPDNYTVSGFFYTNGYEEYYELDRIPVDGITEYDFTATVYYGDEELYSIDFTRIDAKNDLYGAEPIREFSGGSGTAENPYLISNAVQLSLVGNDLTAHYKLIANIDADFEASFAPIGTYEDPFEGTFDGNGYTISNLTVQSSKFDDKNVTITPTTGLFGVNEGEVRNLTLKDLSVISDVEQDKLYPQNDNSEFFVGGIAGINSGYIGNCNIDNAVISVHREKTDDGVNRSVSVYVGGIVGENSGAIEYCSVDMMNINAKSNMKYIDSAPENRNNVYVGGIAAMTYNLIQYCRVSDSCTINAEASSTANTSSNQKPYVTVHTGGIVGDEYVDVSCISNVYSGCKTLSCIGNVYNEGHTWIGEHLYGWDNVSIKVGAYYPVFYPLSDGEYLDEMEMKLHKTEHTKLKQQMMNNKNWGDTKADEEANKKVKFDLKEQQATAIGDANALLSGKVYAKYDDAVFTKKETISTVEIKLNSNAIDNNSTSLIKYFDKLIDEEKKTKNIAFVDDNGKSYNATVVGYYGFDVYHDSFESRTITVRVFFDAEGVLYYDDVDIVVEGKKLVDYRIESFIGDTLDKDADEEACNDAIFRDGFTIVYEYNNGDIETYNINRHYDANDNLISDTSDQVTITWVDLPENANLLEPRQLVITHVNSAGETVEFEQTVKFTCNHTFADFTKTEIVSPCCKYIDSEGYEVWECQKGCGEVRHMNYFKAEHTYAVEEGYKATCKEAGHTDRVYCSVCEMVFDDGKWIQTLEHDYVSDGQDGYVTSEQYPASEFHYCKNGDHYEAHQFTVTEMYDEEFTLIYRYTCSCGYEDPKPDYNIKYDDNGGRPLVFVTDGYVTEIGDEVVVYVEILNNPGFNGAAFGIRYDDNLELVSVEESDIIPRVLKVNNPVYHGYNFVWGDDNNYTTEDGSLLKLTFKYLYEPKDEEEAKNLSRIYVVYGMSNSTEGGFACEEDTYKFMTQSGTVTKVDRLPGDVRGDGTVDIMDATYIAWFMVGKSENGTPITVNKKYADVNLDGKVDIDDVLTIMQFISGNGGKNLLNPNYRVFLNLNGFTVDGIDDSVTVAFYDDDGNRNSWDEYVRFSEYKALMNELGYTFVGWYTRMDCTCQEKCTHALTEDAFIEFDEAQWNQTLYAHWEKNKITFDMNGATSAQLADIICDSTTTVIDLTNSKYIPALSYDVEYVVTNFAGIYATLPVYKTFEGWYVKGTDQKLTSIDLSQPNIGTIILEAKWSEKYVWDIPTETRYGYADVTSWFFKSQYNDNKYLVSAISEDTVTILRENGWRLYGQENLIEYKITYTGDSEIIGFVPANDKYTVRSTFKFESDLTRTGHKFDGWYTNIDGTSVKVESVDLLINKKLGDVTLEAKWIENTYKVVYKGNGATNKTEYTSNHTYTVAKNLQANEFERKHSVTLYYGYDNKSEVKTVKWSFNGWKGQDGKTYIDKELVINLIAVNNETFVMTAQWSSGSITLPTPTRTGYYFLGWYQGSTIINSSSYSTGSDVELTAKWAPKTYAVSYDAAGGSVSVSDAQTYKIYGQAYGDLPTPAREGYAFVRWTLNGVEVNSGTTVSTASNHVLLAVWTKSKVTLGYYDRKDEIVGSTTKTDTFSPGFDTSLLTQLKYTKIKISFNRLDGYGEWGFQVNDDPIVEIYSNSGQLLKRYDLDGFPAGEWANHAPDSIDINLTSMGADCSFKIKYSNGKSIDSYWLGSVEVVVEAIR